MRIVAVIQARTGSSRLPMKVLLPLGRRSVLGQVISRVARCPRLDEVIVATTTDPADDAIVAEAARWWVRGVRGSENDVLSRYLLAARGADVIVRATSDCPLFDPDILTSMLEQFETAQQSGPVDYLSNTLVRTLPRGLDAEIFTYQALERAARDATDPSEREHVTLHIYRHPERFHLKGWEREPDLSHYRWTIDTPDDYALLKAIYDELGDDASTDRVVALLERRPDLVALNAHVRQKPI